MDTTRPSLLVRVKNPADTEAWRQFDALYRPILFHFARARGLPAAEAEDVTQQCLTEICGQIRRFRYDPAHGRFRQWLKTIVHRRVLNLLRSHRERQVDSSRLREQADSGESPEALFDRLWLQAHLKHCLELVRDDIQDATYRAFHEYVLEERPIEEVCRRLSMNRAQIYAIKWRVSKMVEERMKWITGGAD
jgi:RNA polymerase sigma-70 factor, ECF subfamily